MQKDNIHIAIGDNIISILAGDYCHCQETKIPRDYKAYTSVEVAVFAEKTEPGWRTNRYFETGGDDVAPYVNPVDLAVGILEMVMDTITHEHAMDELGVRFMERMIPLADTVKGLELGNFDWEDLDTGRKEECDDG